VRALSDALFRSAAQIEAGQYLLFWRAVTVEAKERSTLFFFFFTL